VYWDGAKPQNCVVQNFCTKGGQILLSLPSTRENFKRDNLTIHAVNFCKTFCTCSFSILRQDPMVKFGKVKRILFGLLELEMTDLGCFFDKKAFVLWGLKYKAKFLKNYFFKKEVFYMVESEF
jgi:hypothetical protein